jgi:hypothetical protein
VFSLFNPKIVYFQIVIAAKMEDGNFKFRAILIKIQNKLSDDDRRQLHFLFSDDIPRRLQADGSLGNSLDVLQKLFDNEKISKDNCGYIIQALQAIERPDCVQHLIGKI